MMEMETINHLGEIDPVAIAALVGGCIFFVLSISRFFTFAGGEGRIRRSMIERHQTRLKNQSMRRGRVSENHKARRRFAGVMKIVGLLPNDAINKAQQKLKAAGYSDNSSIFIFWTIKLVGALFFLAFCGLYLFSGIVHLENGSALVIIGILSFCSVFAPDYFVNMRKTSRLKNIERRLPDGLDLLVICAEAGLSLDASLKRVADEFVTAVPELSEELLLTSVELNFLPDRRQALANLAQRVDVPAFRGVTATLIQTEKYGTPLAQALRTLASEYRETRLLKAEEKAARLPAILTVPMILFILPALFIVLAAPAFIKVAEKFGN